MRIWFILGLIFTALSTPLQAQTPPDSLPPIVGVQSGEHPTYSRLVLTITPQITWQINQEEKYAQVILSDGVIDASTIFKFIPRTRILQATSYQNKLSLMLGCACVVNSFLYENTFLVIDIQDPPIQPAPNDQQNANAIQTIKLPQTIFPTQQTNVGEKTKQIVNNIDVKNPGKDEVALQDLSKLQTQINKALSRAMTNGFLDRAKRTGEITSFDLQPTSPASDNVAKPDTENLSKDDTTISPKQQADDILKQLEAKGAVRVTGAGQPRPSLKDTSDPQRNFDGTQCYDHPSLDHIATAKDLSFQNGLTLYRTTLYKEFDKLDETIAYAYVNHLISYGFGAEARAFLQQTDLDDRDDILSTLSYIVDDGYHNDADHWVPQLSCEGPAAFWAALALQTIPQNAVLNENALVQHLGKLSEQMQLYLGPMLSARLSKSNYMDEAALINRALSRITNVSSDMQILTEAKILRKNGDHQEADILLSQLINVDGDIAAQAMIEFVDLRVQHDIPIEPDQAELIASKAFIMRTTPMGQNLQHTLVQALAMAGLFERAITQTENMSQDGPHLGLWLSEMVARKADLETFVTLAFDPPKTQIRINQHPAFAQRLADIGFEDAANAIGYQPTPSDTPTKAQNTPKTSDNNVPAPLFVNAQAAPVEILNVTEQILNQNQTFMSDIKVILDTDINAPELTQ